MKYFHNTFGSLAHPTLLPTRRPHTYRERHIYNTLMLKRMMGLLTWWQGVQTLCTKSWNLFSSRLVRRTPEHPNLIVYDIENAPSPYGTFNVKLCKKYDDDDYAKNLHERRARPPMLGLLHRDRKEARNQHHCHHCHCQSSTPSSISFWKWSLWIFYNKKLRLWPNLN